MRKTSKVYLKLKRYIAKQEARILCSLVVVGLMLITFILLGSIAEYILSEFVFLRHNYLFTCNNCQGKPRFSKDPKQRSIPKHIHQIFFFETDKVLPSKLRDAQLSWQQQNPGYAYTLWNKTSIKDLMHRQYPHLEDIYNSYGHWVRQADMARYIVMHHHGGWYIDIDIHCKKGIEELSTAAAMKNKHLVVRWTEPVGCSNDFIGVLPNHPFFTHVLYGMAQSNKWYIFPYATTMFSTGPLFLWGRMLNYPFREEDIYWLFNHSRYFDLIHGSSWHSWDGKIIWYFFNPEHKRWQDLFALLAITACVTLSVVIYRKLGCLCCSYYARKTKQF